MSHINPKSTSVKTLTQAVIRNTDLTRQFDETSTHLTNNGSTVRWHFSDLTAALQAVLELTQLEIPHLFIDDDKQAVMIVYDWPNELDFF